MAKLVLPKGTHAGSNAIAPAAGIRAPHSARELVQALHDRTPGTRAELWKQIRQQVEKLIDRLVKQYQLQGQREVLVLHALHTAETWLRTRPMHEFDNLTWPAFQATVLLQVAKLAVQPFGQQGSASTPARHPAPLPESRLYHSATVFLPFERVGNTLFGGDWYGGQQASDRSLWILLADVTGHGYYAYLLASVLPQVWQSCWAQVNRPECQPTDLLHALHYLLEDCLPEGVFVEATLVRLGADGAVVVAPAGGTRLFLNRLGTDEVSLIKLRGGWIGFLPANPADQFTTTLGQGDELVLATDGLFDQLALLPEATLKVLRPGEGSLLDQVQQQLMEALRAHAQKDDITLVALRRLLLDDSRPGD